jgi:predicted phage terminase large subunit-like protein
VTASGSKSSRPVRLQYFTGSLPIRPFDFSKVSQKAPKKPEPFAAWLQRASPDYKWDWPYLQLIRAHLDRITDGTLKRLAIFIPPRHGKSALATIRYPVYRLLCEPALRVIIGCYNSLLAEKFSRQALRIARECGVSLNPERQAVHDWETLAGGGLRAVGVGAGITGQGGGLVIIDDPVKSREEANSLAYRERVWDWYREDLYTRLEPGGAVVLIQTRWHEDDLAGRILASETAGEWTVLNLPAEAEAGDPLGRAAGEPLCPERFDRAALADIRATLGTWAYTALYQQRPLPAGGGMFKREWLPIVEAAPAQAIKVRYWDKAGSQGAGDYSACVRMSKTPDGLYYVEDVVRGQWSAFERRRIERQTAEIDGIAVAVWLEQEPGSGGKESAEESVSRLAGFNVHAEPVTGAKDVRAAPFAAQCEAGNVRLVRGAWCASYIDELVSFPSGVHDDQVDASAGAFNKLAMAGTGASAVIAPRDPLEDYDKGEW